jgi:type III secretory pathway component EscR
MWNTNKVVGVLAVICVLAGFFFSVNSPTSVTDTPHSNAVPQTKLEPTAEVQPTATGQDPFKKFLEEKSSNQNSSAKAENTQPSPVQLGKDPFKEFLDKQKQNSKDQVVSPFGKN